MNIYVSFALHLLAWLALSYVFISFGEYQFHRHLMHRKRLPKRLYRLWPYIQEIFTSHAVEHHGMWYKQFDYEPDTQGREHNLDIRIHETVVMVLCLAPIFVTLFWLSPSGGAIVLGVVIIHNRLWNMLHRQMHIPKNTFFKNWAVFHFLARQHFLHHRHTNKNYNVVFPLFDYVFGSVAKPSFAEIRELLRLGHLRPRAPGSRARVRRWRESVASQRENAA